MIRPSSEDDSTYSDGNMSVSSVCASAEDKSSVDSEEELEEEKLEEEGMTEVDGVMDGIWRSVGNEEKEYKERRPAFAPCNCEVD